ncbi:MAG: MurR/RpiR family transcriptional regulator [Bradyrhizobium sp.]|nr:MurR/RpiR family transcriptional regulator [Bradyrhizobium sp.]
MASGHDTAGSGSGVAADDIIAVVRQIAPTLSRSEQRVATTVLADVDYAVHASNGDLARRAGVSEPTVTRFSRSVGCRGVRELKVRLAQAMAVGRIYLELPPHVGTDLARPALWQSVFREIRGAISAVEQQLHKEDIEKAAEAIANCSRLAAFGIGGGSTIAAIEVEHRFFRLGIAVSHSSDPKLMRMVAATLGRNDVVIAISTTGNAAEVIAAATVARQYGALIIAITKPGSPLAATADIALGLHVAEAPDALKPTASRYALLAAIDLLAAATAYCKPREAQARMRRIKYELMKADGSANDPLGD